MPGDAHWPSAGTLAFRWTVPAHPLALSVVRRGATAVGDVCGREAADTVALILSELLTNSLRHARLDESDEVAVGLEIEGAVRGWVEDPGTGFKPRPARPTPEGDGGYGLYIVEQLARRWGVDRSGAATKVWFEL